MADRPVAPNTEPAPSAVLRRVRLDACEIADLCARHCEHGDTLTDEEIDKLIDTAWVAVDYAAALAAREETT